MDKSNGLCQKSRREREGSDATVLSGNRYLSSRGQGTVPAIFADAARKVGLPRASISPVKASGPGTCPRPDAAGIGQPVLSFPLSL